MVKKIIVGVLLVSAFLVGYGPGVDALYGRGSGQGHFLGNWDSSGDYVLRPWQSPTPDWNCAGDGTYALAYWIDTKQDFINYMWCKLNSAASTHVQREDRTAAAFIVQTMRGTTACEGGSGNNCRPSDASWNDWVARINNPNVSVNWDACVSWSINSLYQGNPPAGNSSPNDDAFYNSSGSSCQAIVFSWSGGSYTLRRQCANPVAWGEIPALPPAIDFNMSGSSSVNDTTVTPGQTITFSHSLTNGGPTGTSPTSISWTTQQGLSASGPWVNVSTGNAGTFTNGQSKTPSGSGQTVNVSSTATAGAQICRRITWTPDTETGGSGSSTPACATVQRTYTLTPTVQASAAYAQAGDTVTFTYRITNSGPHDTTAALSVCKTVGKVHPPGSPLPAQFADRSSDSGQNPPAASCPSPITGNSSPVTVASEYLQIGAGLAPGTMVCRSLVINPYNASGGTYSASPEACVTVAKAPYVQFGGNDVWAGGGFAAVTPACNTSAKIATISRAVPFVYSPFNAQYYNNITLSGSPVLTRSDPIINFSWGAASPGAGVNTDVFSARWTGTQSFPTDGSYTFSTLSDDGVRVYVDGNLVIDNWTNHGPTVDSASVTLAAGNHTIVMEYYENTGGAVAQLSITSADTAGSSTEYQAFALNRISDFGSGGRALVGAGALGDLPRMLTYGNAESNTSWLGFYGAAQHCITDYSSIFGTLPPTAGPAALPVPWVSQNIGAVGAPGSISFSGSTFTVEASGADIWGTSDEFRYTYRSLSGDGEISARINTLTPSNAWAKSGVMIRETLAADSKHAFTLVSASNGTAFQRRTTIAGTTDGATTSPGAAPYWVRLVRSGNTFTGYTSPDGNNWTQIGTDTISMSSDVYIGLAVTSHNDGVLTSSVIDDVRINGVLVNQAPGALPQISDPVSGAWRVQGSIELSGAMPAGSRKVYYVEGDVTISNNITYPASYADAQQIPGLLVVATGEIRVGSNVTQMDGQFVSRSVFYTCYPKIEPATTSTCNQPLTVNGAVMTSRLDLFRTRGADGTTPAERKAPAELFNFNAEMYLGSPLNNTAGQTTVNTVNTIELPPRF